VHHQPRRTPFRRPAHTALMLALALVAGGVPGEPSAAAHAMSAPAAAQQESGAAQTVPISDAARALLGTLGFQQDAIAEVVAGQPVAVIIQDSGDEAAQAGAVWVNASQDTFVQRFNDIKAFEASDAISALQRASSPPVAADFNTLDFPEKDVEALGTCRDGDCAVKIGRAGLARFQQQVDASAADALGKGRALLREILFGYVQAYLRQGAAGLPTFTDKSDPTSVDKELDAIIANSPYLAAQAPALASYINSFPSGAPASVDEFFYWQVGNIGLKPIVTVDHAIVLPAADNNGVTAVAVVQLYSSHYFYAALQLYFLMPPADGSDGFLLVAVNRSRSDGLTGFTGHFVRGRAERAGRKSLQGFLGVAKQRVEGSASGS